MKDPIELNNTIEKSIELSKAINDLGALTVIAGVFLALVIIMFGFFIYQLLSQQKTLSTISKASDLTTKYFENKVKSEINLDQARSIVSRSYARLSSFCVIKVIKLRLEHADEATYKTEIELYVDSMMKDHKSYLQKFSFKSTNILSLFDDTLGDAIKLQMLRDSITKNDHDIYKLEENYQLIFERYDHQLESKISDLNNL